MDITFSKQRRSEGVENDAEKNVMTLKAGRLYSGRPYTHGGSHAMLEPEELPAGTYRVLCSADGKRLPAVVRLHEDGGVRCSLSLNAEEIRLSFLTQLSLDF